MRRKVRKTKVVSTISALQAAYRLRAWAGSNHYLLVRPLKGAWQNVIGEKTFFYLNFENKPSCHIYFQIFFRILFTKLSPVLPYLAIYREFGYF